jgi:hypothetical protein
LFLSCFLFSLGLGFLFSYLLSGCCYVLRSVISITLLLHNISVLFRLISIISMEKLAYAKHGVGSQRYTCNCCGFCSVFWTTLTWH